jgi:hypothetical protein
MAANGISTLATKQLKQEAKLAQATTDRANVGHPRSTLVTSQLPSLYAGNVSVSNPNAGNIAVVGRPWTA